MSNEYERKYSDVVKGIEEELAKHKPTPRPTIDIALWPHPSQIPGPSQRTPGRFF